MVPAVFRRSCPYIVLGAIAEGHVRRMPQADHEVLGAPRRDRRRVARDRAGRGRDRGRARDAPLRDPTASPRTGSFRWWWCCRRPPQQVAGGPALLPPEQDQGGAARRRHLAFGRRVAAGRRRAAGHGEIQPHPRDRLCQSRGGGRARRHQSRHQQRGRRRRLLLRARSVLADRLHHRRQYRGEFRRRALPEIRHDHEQRARLRNGADDRRGPAHRRQASRFRRLRPARHHHRLGRAARRGHRDHRADPEKTGDRAGLAGRLRKLRGRRRMRRPHHRRRASSRAAWR